MARLPRHQEGLKAGSIGPETASSRRRPRALVILHRVPPDIKILTPARRFFSSTITRAPHWAARMPANRPAAPAPSTATSKSYR